MSEKFWIWLSWKLPNRLVYWCAMRVGAAATTNRYKVVPDLTFMDALKRWENTLKDPIWEEISNEKSI